MSSSYNGYYTYTVGEYLPHQTVAEKIKCK